MQPACWRFDGLLGGTDLSGSTLSWMKRDQVLAGGLFQQLTTSITVAVL
jgi:hypothetical protein